MLDTLNLYLMVPTVAFLVASVLIGMLVDIRNESDDDAS